VTWWDAAVGYEVYLRSFSDGTGDGVGDLQGLHDRLDHLAWLGVDLVWVTPFYPSPMRDHGYDVADYRGVEPVFGDSDLLDACIARTHELGMRFMVDLVPNHSSSEHVWFQSARSSRESPHRDYYIWRDPAPDGGPPNNWMSVFGGPAWSLDEATGQYWLHLFLPEQPDLNWDNPAVRDEFDEILRFWLDRGVDGFRIDVAHALVKHPALPDNPPAEVPDAAELGTVATEWESLEHIYDTDQQAVVDVYRRWREVMTPYDAVLLGEVYLLDADLMQRYLDGSGLHLAFWFKPLHVRWDAEAMVAALREGTELPAGRVAWVQGSHDRHRAASRYGGGDLGRRRQLAVAVAQFGLPGVAFIYQGEELGLLDGQLSLDDAQDPVALHEGNVDRGRDAARTPIPWAPGPGMGFTLGARPWLPLGGRTDEDTVAQQAADDESWLSRYRELVSVRRSHLRLGDMPVRWLDAPAGTLAFRRGDALVACNLTDDPCRVPLPDDRWTVRYVAGDADLGDGHLALGGATAVVATAS